jgi:hypothetical protein
MLKDLRRRWYSFFYRIISTSLRIIFIIEAGFVGRSFRRKLAHYSTDIISWGLVILILIYVGETLDFPITYYDVYSLLFVRNLIIMATVSILFHISISELSVRIIPVSTASKKYLRPILITLAMIVGHDFIFSPKLLA